MIRKIVRFFDKLEDAVRAELSRAPIVYALIAGIGIVLFWRGIWHMADEIPFFTGPISALLGTLILLITGVFVSAFVGSRLIISGITQTKKTTDKTANEIEAEIKEEKAELDDIRTTLHKIEQDIQKLK